MFAGKPSTQGIDIAVDDEEKLCISVRIDVYYGHVLPDLAAQVRMAVADAVASQVGMQVQPPSTCTSTASSSPDNPESVMTANHG